MTHTKMIRVIRKARMMAFSQWCIQNPSTCPLDDSLEAGSTWSCRHLLASHAELDSCLQRCWRWSAEQQTHSKYLLKHTSGSCAMRSPEAAASITSGGEHLWCLLVAEGALASHELRSASELSIGSVMSSCEPSSCGAPACTILTSPGIAVPFIVQLAAQAWPLDGQHCCELP